MTDSQFFKRVGHVLEVTEMLPPQNRDLDAARDLRVRQNEYRVQFGMALNTGNQANSSKKPELPVNQDWDVWPPVLRRGGRPVYSGLSLEMAREFVVREGAQALGDGGFVQISNHVIDAEKLRRAEKKKDEEERAQSRIAQLLVGVPVYNTVKAKKKKKKREKKKKKKKT